MGQFCLVQLDEELGSSRKKCLTETDKNAFQVRTIHYVVIKGYHFLYIFIFQEELDGSGQCLGYRQMHKRLRDDFGLRIDRYESFSTFAQFKKPH